MKLKKSTVLFLVATILMVASSTPPMIITISGLNAWWYMLTLPLQLVSGYSAGRMYALGAFHHIKGQ